MYFESKSVLFYDVSARDKCDVYQLYSRMLVGSTQSKHLPQTLVDDRAQLFDYLAQAVNYPYPRIGVGQGLTQDQDIQFTRALATVAERRPVKFVITRDDRIWADNTHGALASLLQYGTDVRIEQIPHYFIDLRLRVPVVINRPDTLIAPHLQTVINNALNIQKRLVLGWRPITLSFTIAELFEKGGYKGSYADP